MEHLFSNVTLNSSKPEVCLFGPQYLLALSLNNIITLLMGQPVIARLLWIIVTLKKTADILNCNLALFHNVQYLMSFVHLIILFWLPHVQIQVLRFLLVYAQIGGPMSLTFICMERYVAVIHPTSYTLLKKYRCREVCAVAVWVFSVPTALASVLVVTSLSKHVLRILPVYMLAAMIALMVRCSVSIMRALKTSGPGRDELHPVKRRAFKTVSATLVISILCYTPVTLLERFATEDEYTFDCIVAPGCILLLSAASVVHPLFYLSTQRKLFTCLK